MDNLLLLDYAFGKRNDFDKLTTMNKIELQLFLLFMGLASHRFKWEGLPKELPAFKLERILCYYGWGILMKIPETEKYCFLPCVQQGELNIYGEPTKVQPIAVNGKHFDVVNVDELIPEEMQGVIIRNNATNTPMYFMLKPVIDRLCFIWEGLGINEGLSRIKALIHANKDLSGTIKREIKNILGNDNPIPVVSEKSNLLKEIEKLDLDVEYTPDKYWEDFDNTFNFACELIGVTTNMSNQKKERLIVSEVESNDECTTIIEDMSLDYRRYGCELAKELFGLSLSVDNKEEDVKTTQPDKNPQPKQPE